MKNFLAILQIVPALIAIITSLETAIPMSGQGKAKLDIIKSILNVASDSFAEIWPAIEKIVGVFVTAANAIGAFKSTPSA